MTDPKWPGESYEEVPLTGGQVEGPDAFVEELRQRASDVVPRLRRLSLDRLAREVAAAEGVSVAVLRGAGSRRAEARARAVLADRAQREGGMSIARVAAFLGRDGSTLAKGVGRLRGERAIVENARIRD